MTQKIETVVLKQACENHLHTIGVDLAIDLLSLRAAVRRVLDADEKLRTVVRSYPAMPGGIDRGASEMRVKARCDLDDAWMALRAEMAGIDGKQTENDHDTK